MENELFALNEAQVKERLELKYVPESDLDMQETTETLLTAYHWLYDKEENKTPKVKKDCLWRAYWDICRPWDMSYSEFEIRLVIRALELMKSMRFKNDLTRAGIDYVSQPGKYWWVAYIVASHFVLEGSDTVHKYVRHRKDTPLRVDPDVEDPVVGFERIREGLGLARFESLFYSFFPDADSLNEMLSTYFE